MRFMGNLKANQDIELLIITEVLRSVEHGTC